MVMQLVDGRYLIGGVDALEICRRYGTPLYVYDAEKITAQYNLLHDAFKEVSVRINYACKALTNINILKLFRSLGAGLDTVSIQEVELGLKAGFRPDDIIYTPNCVGIEEIRKATACGVRINIDNISILEQFGHEFGGSYPICIRINPHIMAGGNTKISTGHIDSKFGISIYQMRHLQRVIASDNIRVNGLHMHTGSDILDIEVFLRGAEILLETAMEHFPDLDFIDFGSGFKVRYKENDIETDVLALGNTLGNRFREFCGEYGKELDIMFEPGKFLVSESGFLMVRTNVIKQTTATVFAGVDSGQNHLIRPMMYDAYHDITNLSNPGGRQRIYTVVGYICETDTFGWDRRLDEVREGDILAIHNAGAYGFSMSSNYNSRYRPAEVLVYKGEILLIREREDINDLLRRQVEHEI
jgi:diaminopimelate decarboxylase